MGTEAGQVVLGVMLVAMAVGGDAVAGQVNWGSERFATNLTSGGQELDGGFTFELGAFEDGFVPTVANRDEWMGRWHRAAGAAYNEVYRFFAGSVLVDSGDPAFASAGRGYIWGFDSRERGRSVEWILITDPSWLWPSGGGFAPPVEWCVAGAADAVVGQINAPDGSCHMRSAGLILGGGAQDPLVWRETTFGVSSSDEAVAGWDADPDADGLSNLLEFALGTAALRGDGGGAQVLGVEVVDGAAYRTLTIERVRRPSIDYIPEVSSDLATWSGGEGVHEVVEDSEHRLRVRDRMPLDRGRKFIRLRVAFRSGD